MRLVPNHPQSPDAHTGNTKPEEEPEKSREQVELATSNNLVQMVDILFALVLGLGIVTFHDVIVSFPTVNYPAWLALLTIYYTIVRSFVGWHEAMAWRHYRIVTFEARTTELWRLYVDALIVALYAYMWYAAEPLTLHRGADIRHLFYAFPLLFLLYLAWGQFRRIAWGQRNPYLAIVLSAFGGAYLLLAIAYPYVHSHTSRMGDAHENSLFLVIAFFLMGLYRYLNFWQSEAGKKRTRWLGFFPRPQFPRLRAATKGSQPASLQTKPNRQKLREASHTKHVPVGESD